MTRTTALGLATCGLVFLSAAFGQEPDKKGKKITVREFDLNGHLPVKSFIRGLEELHKATAITSDRKLAEAFPDKGLQAAIAKHVNFDKEELLLFAWEDSTREYNLSYKIEEGKAPVVVFRWLGTMKANDDIRFYAHLFVIPKGTAWRFFGK